MPGKAGDSFGRRLIFAPDSHRLLAVCYRQAKSLRFVSSPSKALALRGCSFISSVVAVARRRLFGNSFCQLGPFFGGFAAASVTVVSGGARHARGDGSLVWFVGYNDAVRPSQTLAGVVLCVARWSARKRRLWRGLRGGLSPKLTKE